MPLAVALYSCGGIHKNGQLNEAFEFTEWHSLLNGIAERGRIIKIRQDIQVWDWQVRGTDNREWYSLGNRRPHLGQKEWFQAWRNRLRSVLLDLVGEPNLDLPSNPWQQLPRPVIITIRISISGVVCGAWSFQLSWKLSFDCTLDSVKY